MEERRRKIVVCHGKRPVERPKRRPERVGNSWEAGTRGSVSLEHDERLPVLSRKLGRVDVARDQVCGVVVL